MHPILFTLARRPVYSYTVVMAVTLMVVIGWLIWQQRRGRQGALDLGLLALAAGLIGARIGHVLANWEYYGERWLRVIDLRDGGLSWHGALLAGMLTLLVLAVWQRDRGANAVLRVREMLAVLLVPLCIGLLGGWLACLLAGCAYGMAIPPPQRFYTPDWPDNFGVLAFRLPSQVLGIGLALLLLLLVRPLQRRPGIFLILWGLGSFLIGWTRGDLHVSWGPLRVTQWIDLVLIAAGAALEILGQRAGQRETQEA